MSSQECGKISAESVRRAVAFIDRRYRGEHVASAFEAETGICGDNLRKWREGVSMPGWRHAIKMILVFGPEFLAATLDNAPAWLDAAARKEMARKLSEQIERDQRALKDLTNL